MANTTSAKLTWCVAKIGEEMNWWVTDISDPTHWDTDGLAIIDPRQLQHLLELMDPLQDYGLQTSIVEEAFFAFAIESIEKDKSVRLRRVDESLLESDDQLFALPDIIDDEKGPFADLVEHLTKTRIKMLNDLIDFSQKLTVEELVEEIREIQNGEYLEGKPSHFFTELTAILEYVPEGFELDGDDDEGDADEDEIPDDLPEMDDDDENLEKDETMKWDEDEEEEEGDFGDEFNKKRSDDDDDDLADDDEETDDDEEDEDNR